MVEIRERNPKLRLLINAIITLFFIAIFAYYLLGLLNARSEAIRIDSELIALETDLMAKQRDYLKAETDFKARRQWMTSRESVEASMKIQELQEQLKTAEKIVSERKLKLEERRDEIQKAIYAMIILVIVYAVVMWINYILNY